MGWKIDYKGAVLREEDVLNAHVTLANQVLGTTGWDVINPMASPEALIVWTAITISENTKTALEEVLVFVQQLKLHDVLACFDADAAPEPPEAAPQVRSAGPKPPAGPKRADFPPLPPEQEAARRQVLEQMTAAR